MKNQSTRGNSRIELTNLRKRVANIPSSLEAILNVRVAEARPEGMGEEQDVLNRVQNRRLKSLADIIANNSNAATDLKRITPYITKADVIWRTLILHPNGARKNILTYETNQSQFKNAKLHEALLKVLSEYYTNDYKIEEELPDMVSDLLIGTGSYVKLNIPRPALDNLINGNQTIEGSEAFNSDLYRRNIDSEMRKQFKEDKLFGEKVALYAKNSGYVRNPAATKVGGLEGIWGGQAKDDEYEFHLLDKSFGITVTDNINCLSLRSARQRIQENMARIEGNESISNYITNRLANQTELDARNEAKKKAKGKDQPNPAAKTINLNMAQQEALQQIMPGDRSYATKATQSLRVPRAYSRGPWGSALTYHLPSECTIPVHVNGDVKRLRGCYALIDENGEFLRMTKDYRFYQSISAQNSKIDDKPSGTSTNQLINNLRKVQQGGECDFDMSEFAMVAKQQIEKELYQAIWSGGDGDDISIDLEESVLKLFLERAFQQQRTRVLYIPECYISYMAFQYNRLGVGESLTTQAKDFIARLAALDVADALAQLDNAQTRNELVISLEAEDVDPDSSIAMARYQFFKSNPTVHNLISTGTLSMPMIVDALKEQSLLVRVEANDNKFITAPQVQVNQIERTGFRRVDSESRMYLLSSIANQFGLPRSWLDEHDENGNNFQIEALAEQETLCNQTIMYQTSLAGQVTDVIRKNVMVNEVVMNRLVDTIINSPAKLRTPDSKEKLDGKNEQEKIMCILEDFLQNFYVELPVPTTMESVTKIKEKMELADDWATKVVEMSSSKGLMGPLLNRLGIDEETLSPEEMEAQFAAVIKYQAFKLFNIPTPFDDIMNKGREGGMFSLLNELDYFNENIGHFVLEYKKQFDDRIKRLQDAMPKSEGFNPEEDEQSGGFDDEAGSDAIEEQPDDLGEGGSDDIEAIDEDSESEENEEAEEQSEEQESEESEESEEDETANEEEESEEQEEVEDEEVVEEEEEEDKTSKDSKE